MSQFLARLKALGHKAEQVRLAIDAAPDGELYVLDLDAGTVSRLVAA